MFFTKHEHSHFACDLQKMYRSNKKKVNCMLYNALLSGWKLPPFNKFSDRRIYTTEICMENLY